MRDRNAGGTNGAKLRDEMMATSSRLIMSNRGTPTEVTWMLVRSARSVVGSLLVAVALAAAACAGGADADGADSSGLESLRDSTRSDSVLVRVAGEVAADKMRTVVEELRIQPGAEDTTLFGETFEF